MKRGRVLAGILFIALFMALLASCAPAATVAPAPTGQPAKTQPLPTQPPASSAAPVATPTPAGAPRPTATSAPTAQPTGQAQPTTQPTSQPQTPATSQPTSQPQPTGAPSEQRLVELEWPAALRLGESDLVRLALVPYQEGYVVTAEFPEHETTSQPLVVARLPGFTLAGAARLEGVGFEISPAGEQEQSLPAGSPAVWRWTLRPREAGQQRLSLTLFLRYLPEAGNPQPARQALAYSKGLDVQISSFLGLSQPLAAGLGIFGLLTGLGLSLGSLLLRSPARRAALQVRSPALALVIEPRPGMQLSSEETGLLRAIFNPYGRLVLQSEFLSGYSGARTFLALPVHPDGRVDAPTIVKIGWRSDIQREAENYEQFVKDRLPPVTARIQHAPVTIAGSNRAAVRYTFIAEPGRPPVSLRQVLLEKPDPAPIYKLFETFGPNWWMQRRAASFRAAVEYDRLLPPHYVLQPEVGRQPSAKPLSETLTPADALVGDHFEVQHFQRVEARADGVSYTLFGRAAPGQPPLRLRWLSPRLPDRTPACLAARRGDLLAGWTAPMERFGLPDPLTRLPAVLESMVQGTRSVIHGDLNLENILVGPGGLVWLIDFAETREGHPLFDFSHLAAELIAHILTPAAASPQAYLASLESHSQPLLNAVEEIAARCLFDPARPAEYHISLYLSCLGALKYNNLTPQARHLLYLTAAWTARNL